MKSLGIDGDFQLRTVYTFHVELKLALQGEVPVLEVQGGIEADKIPALKAGILTYCRVGKTRIVLNVTSCAQVQLPVLTEVLRLSDVAGEYRAILAFVGPEPVLQSAAKAGGISGARIFATVEAALAAMPPDPIAELRAELAKRDERIAALEKEKTAIEGELHVAKGRLQNSDVEAMKKLRSEHGDLKSVAAALEDQVRALLKGRKVAYEAEGLQTRVAQLEASLLECAKAASGAGGGAPAASSPAPAPAKT